MSTPVTELLPPPFTISALSDILKQHIEKDFSYVRVLGEISSCKKHTSGHIYFSLKDKEAVLDAICWRSVKLSLPLEEGLNVVCTGRITTYPSRSKYQLIVTSVQQEGVGSLLKMLEEKRKLLAEEGLFSSKRPLPFLNLHIGIITSPTGAVLQDMLHRIQDRMPCHVSVYPVAVQGPSCAEEVIAGLSFFKEMKQPPSVLIIARGGGSVEDLWGFNDEALVRAIAASPIPTVSAIGHETDHTLSDEAADVRAPTPTAAAERVCPVKTDLLSLCTHHQWRLFQATQRRFSEYLQRAEGLCRRMIVFAYRQELFQQRLDEYSERLTLACAALFQKAAHRQSLIEARLRAPLKEIGYYHQRLSALQIGKAWISYLPKKEHSLLALSKALSHLSYQDILDRGFALVKEGGKTITKASETHPLQEVSLCFSDGRVSAIIQPS